MFGQDLSDASVAMLSAMPELEDLALRGRALTDAGLGGLGKLSKFRRLRLFETAVTTNGVAALTNQLPQLKVEALGLDGHD